MKKIFPVFLVVLAVVLAGCRSLDGSEPSQTVWDKDNIFYINNSTDEEILALSGRKYIRNDFGSTGLDYQFSYLENNGIGNEYTHLRVFNIYDSPKYCEIREYVLNGFLKHDSTPYSFTLEKRDEDFYLIAVNSRTGDRKEMKYLVSTNYLYLFE